MRPNFRKTIGQLLGGAAVLIGAGIAYYQSQLTQQASHDQIISQQVAKGLELLGDDKVARRLGGIYALEGVMNTSQQYHQPVLEALCAFVRDGAKAKITKAKTEIATNQEPPATDIQSALTVIGRRADGPGDVDLISAYLPNANLPFANLTDVNLTGADLVGSSLSAAFLSNANLTGANLSGANLTGAILPDVNLTGANLTTANLTGANLTTADLTGAHLTNASLSATNLTDANLTDADLTGANLTGAGVTQSQLDKACGDKATMLNSGLILKPCK
jgi:uncharacterized protein YjbI with pentapeptide repeats